MPEIIVNMADSIHTNLPYRMKLAIAISELVLFFSEFRINIKHWNGSIIPINSLTFCIAKSGASKDSSVKMCRKCFSSGYEAIEEYRKNQAIEKAIKQAEEAGVDIPTRFAGYKDFLEEVNPLFIAIPTYEGFIQHITDLGKQSFGSGYVYSGEFASELVSNSNFVDLIRLMSELYDTGDKEAKIIKNKEQQNKAIHSFPVSAMFLSSPNLLLFDESAIKKFKIEFTSKLARRSFLVYADDPVVQEQCDNVQDLIRMDREREDKAIENRNKVNEYIKSIVPAFLDDENRPPYLTVSEEVRDLFNFYKRYNEACSETISDMYPITKICRSHLQWKAFKLAGAFALMDLETEIQVDHYRRGIEYCELTGDDMNNFEKELIKEPYERFVTYNHSSVINGQNVITLHELKKSGFISNRMTSSKAVAELVKLSNSYDKLGEYTFEEKSNTVKYREYTQQSNLVGLSYLVCEGTKEERKPKCDIGYTYEEVEFNDIEALLEGDFAYTGFKFSNGKRNKDNIASGTKLLILDIDKGEFTDQEAHVLLEDINHFIVRSSDKNNDKKFRVIIQLDKEINVSNYNWVPFIRIVARELGFLIDEIPKSQIFFSYKTSAETILKQVEGRPLEVQPYLDLLSVYLTEKGRNEVEVENLTEAQRKCLLDDPMTTFAQAYEAKDGEGRRKLIWAIKRARELGSDADYAKQLIFHISQEYWVKHLDTKSLETMYRQIDRWF